MSTKSRMKRSAQVVLVISGALLNGCSEPAEEWHTGSNLDSSQVLTNNTYVPGYGYYHAPYHSFYPHPYNLFIPGRGYYHGGSYSQEPQRSGISASAPSGNAARGSSRGGFVRSSSVHFGTHVSG